MSLDKIHSQINDYEKKIQFEKEQCERNYIQLEDIKMNLIINKEILKKYFQQLNDHAYLSKINEITKENCRLLALLNEMFKIKSEYEKKTSRITWHIEEIKTKQRSKQRQLNEEVKLIKNRIHDKEAQISKLKREIEKYIYDHNVKFTREAYIALPKRENLELNNEMYLIKDVLNGMTSLLEEQYQRNETITKELNKVKQESIDIKIKNGLETVVKLNEQTPANNCNVDTNRNCDDTFRSITSTDRRAIDDWEDINIEKFPVKVNMSSNSLVSQAKMLPPKLDFNPIYGKYVMPNIKIAPEVKKFDLKGTEVKPSIIKESKKSLMIPMKQIEDNSLKLLNKEYESTHGSLNDLKEKLEKQKKRNRELMIKHSSLAKNLKLATNKVEIIKDQITMLGGHLKNDTTLTISDDSSISE